MMNLSKMVKPALMISALAIAVSVSSVANAKAMFTFNLCIDTSGLTNGPGTQSLGGKAVLNYPSALGGPINFGNWSLPIPNCATGGAKTLTATDGTGNWNQQHIGDQAGVGITVVSPILTGMSNTGGACQASMWLNWKINSYTGSTSSGYRNFYPTTGMLVKLHITGDLANNSVTCTLDQK